MVSEVQCEEAWLTRFEAGLASWRMLRTQHIITLYNERLAGEWAEPQPRLALYQQLSQRQATAYKVSCAKCAVSDLYYRLHHTQLTWQACLEATLCTVRRVQCAFALHQTSITLAYTMQTALLVAYANSTGICPELVAMHTMLTIHGVPCGSP